MNIPLNSAINTPTTSLKNVSVKRRTRVRPPEMGIIKLPLLYAASSKIKKAKLTDLIDLLAFVPPIYNDFYKQLNSSDKVESDEENVASSESEAESDE